MKNVFMACLVAIALSGCATLKSVGGEAELPVKYATGKLIEQSGEITYKDVLSRVETTRGIVEDNDVVDVDRLKTTVLDAINLDSLAPSDRILVSVFIGDLESRLDDYDQNLTDEQTRVKILTLLDWIESTAQMYAGTDY